MFLCSLFALNFAACLLDSVIIWLSVLIHLYYPNAIVTCIIIPLLIMAALRSRCGHYILPCGFYNSSLFLDTWCDLSVNLECMSEMCCTRLAEIQDAKDRHLRTIAQLFQAISSQLSHVSTIGKMANSNTSSTCPRNMVNFGPLTSEIGSGVWSTPANFNRFRVFAALLHDTLAALNRGRHLYSTGRPSRWALPTF